MANITTFEYDNKIWKQTGDRYFCDGKPTKKALFLDALAKSLESEDGGDTPEAPQQEAPKSESTTEQAGAFTIVTDKRGRMSFKRDKTILMMVQPTKTHYTVYVSKTIALKPEDVCEKLKDYKVTAVVNPTFKLKEGKDPYSVKATLTEATRNDLPDVLEAILAEEEA